ncbi:hypothetical protein A2U01_0085631, partial [Trifolium medium]|nr:hypothetical protein [Trifolium medium]
MRAKSRSAQVQQASERCAAWCCALCSLVLRCLIAFCDLRGAQ